MLLKAVIFDMDGVIVDSEPLHAHAFLEVAREVGCGDNHGMPLADYIGRSDSDMWTDFIARHRLSRTLEDLRGLKRRHLIEMIRREQPFFVGVLALIEKLVVRYPLALASGSDRPVVEAVLDLARLRRVFSAVVSGSDVQLGKPAPDIFLCAAELLRVEPHACVVVEDSRPGVSAALSAQMKVVAITNTHPAKELASATHVVHTYEEVAELLLGNGGVSDAPCA